MIICYINQLWYILKDKISLLYVAYTTLALMVSVMTVSPTFKVQLKLTDLITQRLVFQLKVLGHN